MGVSALSRKREGLHHRARRRTAPIHLSSFRSFSERVQARKKSVEAYHRGPGEEVLSTIGLPEGMSDTQNRPDLLHSPRSSIPQQKGFALPDSHTIDIRTLLLARRVAHDECSQQGLLPHPAIGR